MSEEINVPYVCPHCDGETTLMVSAESPFDYHIVDECCPLCDAQVEGGNIDKLACDAVADHFAIQGGWVRDIERDLD